MRRDTCAWALPGLKAAAGPKLPPADTSIAYGCAVPSQVMVVVCPAGVLVWTICPLRNAVLPASQVTAPASMACNCPGESVAVGSTVSSLTAADALAATAPLMSTARMAVRQGGGLDLVCQLMVMLLRDMEVKQARRRLPGVDIRG